MVDVSIIIISYNTREMTLACLHSVYEQTKEISFELIVVDNDSKDNSAQAITKGFPDLNLISSKENIGFARANNLAAEIAKGDFLLLLNPDTVVLNGAIQKLLAFARKHPGNRVYGGRTLFGNFTLNPTSCWKKPTLWSLFCYATGMVSIFRRNALFDPESYGPWQRDSVREVDIVTGCFLLIEKKLWGQLDGFDPQFFMYGEDADLCLRAAQEGARPIITPNATIVHYGGASEKVRADKMIRLFRAKEQLIKRHWISSPALLGKSLLRFSVLSRMVACTFLNSISPRRFGTKLESWREIWQRRKEWQSS
ncbi:MAG: glycosyltransferase family 2 protein [Desulfobulbus sp.]|jgi:GT2 family glycosyltransferase|nr:glycosyltransferase family 2 protein [Desulfobulbus sp.]